MAAAPRWRCVSFFGRPLSTWAPTHSVAMRRVAGVARRALRDAGRRLDAGLGVSSSAAAEAAAVPAAAVGAKPSNMQEFKVYRWNPEVAGDKPRLQTYKARRRQRRRRVPSLPPGVPGDAALTAAERSLWRACVLGHGCARWHCALAAAPRAGGSPLVSGTTTSVSHRP